MNWHPKVSLLKLALRPSSSICRVGAIVCVGIILAVIPEVGLSTPTETEVTPDPATANEATKLKIAAVDGTDTEDAKAAYDGMISVHEWVAAANPALYSNAAGNKDEGTGQKCVDLGNAANMLWVSGHGTADAALIYGQTGYGLNTQNFKTDLLAAQWNNNSTLDWVIFAVCNQLWVDTTETFVNTDNAVRWIKKMPNVHSLHGYRGAAPNTTDVDVATQFVDDLKHYSVVNGWLHANYVKAGAIYWPRARSMTNVNNLDDKLWAPHSRISQDRPGKTYEFRKVVEIAKPGGSTVFGVSYWQADLPD